MLYPNNQKEFRLYKSIRASVKRLENPLPKFHYCPRRTQEFPKLWEDFVEGQRETYSEMLAPLLKREGNKHICNPLPHREGVLKVLTYPSPKKTLGRFAYFHCLSLLCEKKKGVLAQYIKPFFKGNEKLSATEKEITQILFEVLKQLQAPLLPQHFLIASFSYLCDTNIYSFPSQRYSVGNLAISYFREGSAVGFLKLVIGMGHSYQYFLLILKAFESLTKGKYKITRCF